MAALQTYSPDGNKIVHTTGVDFNARPSIFKPVHIVQYDMTIPIIAVELYNNGNEYAAPVGASANIRFRKKGGTVVYNAALGCSTDRKIIYFEVTHQMATDYGDFRPIIEIVVGSTIAGSSAINVIIDKNPIQEGDVESSDEWTALNDYVNDAKKYAEQAQQAAQTVEDMRDDLETLNEMRNDLLNTRDIRDSLLDSSGSSLLDNVGLYMYGRITFPAMDQVSTLEKKLNNMEGLLNTLVSKVFGLSNHALLDDKF